MTKNKKPINNDDWLRRRILLFENFCMPSVQNQANQDFIWLVSFDHSTPSFCRQKIADEWSIYSNFQAVFSDGFNDLSDVIDHSIQKYQDPNTKYIITTRLDNDDCIHKDFINTIQASFKQQTFSIVDIIDGYQLSLQPDSRYILKKRHRLNPFISLIEESKNPVTIMGKMHHEWGKLSDSITISNRYLWVQTIHDDNVKNELDRYPRVAKRSNLLDFGIAKEHICKDEMTEFQRLIHNSIASIMMLTLGFFTRFFAIVKSIDLKR